MKQLSKAISIQIILVLFLCTIAFAGSGMSVSEGDVAPDFTLKNLLTDEDITLSDYRGKKIVIIQFWATWCAICKREIPFLVNHYNEYKDKCDVEILAILLPSGEGGKKEVEALVKKYNIPYKILDDKDKIATNKYGLSGLIPVIAVVDKDGIINFEHVGEISITDDPIPFIIEELCGMVEE